MIISKNTGHVFLAVLATTASIVLAPAVEARSRHHEAKAAAKAPAAESNVPVKVGDFGDWTVYKTPGKTKVCYALAQPQSRAPATLKAVAAHIFISNRPAEGVRNEISVIMGVPLRETGADAKAQVGKTSFDLLSKGQNVFVKNAADEARFIDSIKKNGRLVISAPMVKGGTATDTYALSGLAQAIERAAKECQ